jgi:hypothetical protein
MTVLLVQIMVDVSLTNRGKNIPMYEFFQMWDEGINNRKFCTQVQNKFVYMSLSWA